ncbi:putative membrane protein [Desulfitispora alkaliphila]|uniref:general stress protein n=1 Tax=Desulfitispora alkaliphila TaxID=622674 RepID=UPI003D1A5E31
MSSNVVAVFNSKDQAEEAVNALRDKGFDQEISILAKEQNNESEQGVTMENDSVSDGATTGGVIGGLTGLAVGAGALVVPGLGPLIAAGPIAGLLSGAATGGVAGALVDFGIPEAESKRYEEEVKQGNILVTVECNRDRADDAMSMLGEKGSNDVEIH